MGATNLPIASIAPKARSRPPTAAREALRVSESLRTLELGACPCFSLQTG